MEASGAEPPSEEMSGGRAASLHVDEPPEFPDARLFFLLPSALPSRRDTGSLDPRLKCCQEHLQHIRLKKLRGRLFRIKRSSYRKKELSVQASPSAICACRLEVFHADRSLTPAEHFLAAAVPMLSGLSYYTTNNYHHCRVKPKTGGRGALMETS